MLATRLVARIALGFALLGWMTVPGLSQGVPGRVLVGYWHNWGFSPNSLRLTAIPAEYDIVNVSFAVPTVAFGATMQFAPDAGIYPNPGDFARDVATMQAAGKRVQISVGGANAAIHVDSAAKAQNFATSMLQIINTYGFDGLDIDLEGSSILLDPGETDFRTPTTPRIVHFIAAIQRLLGWLPADFTLTAAPETAFVQGGMSAYAGVWGAYLPVLHALRHELTLVHVQHYNTGTMFGRDGRIYSPGTTDFHVAMADALIGGFVVVGGIPFPPFAPRQVAIGLPASTSAAGSGYTAPAFVHTALDRLILGASSAGYQLADPAGYPDFCGLMTWSVNWDVAAGQGFSQPHREYLDRVFLEADTELLSASTGGAAQFTLRAGRAHAMRSHFLLTSVSGTRPGTPLPGGFATLPLNLDALSGLALQPGANSVFSGFVGTLDANGLGSATFHLPPGTNAAGLTFSFAFLLDPPWDFASTSVGVAIGP